MSSVSCPGKLSYENFLSLEIKASKNKQLTQKPCNCLERDVPRQEAGGLQGGMVTFHFRCYNQHIPRLAMGLVHPQSAHLLQST